MSNSNEISGIISEVSEDKTTGTMIPTEGEYRDKPMDFSNNGATVDIRKGERHIFILIENHGQEVAGKEPIFKIVTPGNSEGGGKPRG